MSGRQVYSVSLPAWLAEEMDEDALRQHMNRSEFIKAIYLDWKERQADINEFLKTMAAEAAER